MVRPVAVLTGPPGAGKSTVGAALAAHLGVEVLDTDVLVQQRAGMGITEIFVDLGEQHFRQLEKAAVADALSSHAGVVSLGGGAVLDPDTQELLRGHRVVFLDVSLRHAARRSGFDQGRPLLALNPRGQWLQLMADRRPIYERLAWLHVSTDERSVEDVVEQIAARLGRGEEQIEQIEQSGQNAQIDQDDQTERADAATDDEAVGGQATGDQATGDQEMGDQTHGSDAPVSAGDVEGDQDV